MSGVIRIVLTRSTATVLREIARKRLSVPSAGAQDIAERDAIGALWAALEAQLEETTSSADVTTSGEHA